MGALLVQVDDGPLKIRLGSPLSYRSSAPLTPQGTCPDEKGTKNQRGTALKEKSVRNRRARGRCALRGLIDTPSLVKERPPIAFQ